MKPGRNRIAFSLLTRTLIIFSMVFSHFSYAQNDRITLNDGGTVYGKILNPEADAGMDYKIQITGGGELLIPVRQVRRIVTPGQEMLTYQTTAPFVEDTVEAHLQIAKWCQNNSLSGWAAKHFEHILELDPDYEDAHKALGHVKVDGVWMSEQERYELSGLERRGGILVTHQEALLAQEKEEAARAVSYWKKTIENLYNRMIHGDEEAINQLRNVKNPYALAPVTKRLQKEEDPSLRMVLVQAMGSIGTPAAIGDLGTVVLSDVNQD
ncbi:MAG: HEAT repeat domain-containing protein, partial [Thermoguttaceae bacterium]|nr:HEAT repeat domain-containing protein [Thermoguttaceae bacterium]